MRKIWQSLSEPVQIRRQISRLRFTGYIGVQLSGLLVPLLVFQLTHSASLAGLALFIEWVPKLGLYMLGGSLVQCFSRRRAHLLLEATRLLAMLSLLGCAMGMGSVWIVALAAALYQCTNAISNILFEVTVSHWWPEAERAQGHTLMMRSDQAACAVGLTLGLVMGSPLLLGVVGMVVQLIALLLARQNVKAVYPEMNESKTAQGLAAIAPQICRDLKAVRKPSLLQLAACGALLGIPVSIMYSTPVFYFDRAQPGIENMTLLLSLVLLTKTLIISGLLGWVQHLLKKGMTEATLATIGIVMQVVCAGIAVLHLPLIPAIAAMFGVCIGSTLFTPWMRTRRQELLLREVEESSRSGATGILISVEACSRLCAAAVLTLSGNNLTIGLLTACALGLIGGYSTQILNRRHRLVLRPAETI